VLVDWGKIDTVLLDMDGTLLDLQYDNFFWREHVPLEYADVKKISLAESRSILEPLFRDREGSLEWYCIDYWSERLGLDIAGLKYELRERIAVRPSVVEFLNWLFLEERDVRLVTNAHQKVVDLKMRESGLGRYFSRVITSHEIGAPKEDIRFWHTYWNIHPFNTDRALLIDDSLPVLLAAREFGIAWLRAIRLPDLSASPQEHPQFQAINSFHDLYLPGGAQ
jgi:HAD superfamily hydrolase (TIGR01509 family)